MVPYFQLEKCSIQICHTLYILNLQVDDMTTKIFDEIVKDLNRGRIIIESRVKLGTGLGQVLAVRLA